MNETVQTVFGLIGGLALFLFGMNNMSDALQKAAGEKMKKILEFLTRNPIMGALAGALVTAVLQSSSATTVMVIGFVSAGLMSLPQAISVIFGANIGTTMTAQLMAFKISNYIYPIIFIGFILNFVCKKEKPKSIGMVVFSFGLLFEGIEIMGSVMKPLAGSAFFTDLMGQVTEIPVLGILLGAIMTLVVQSSSATIAVLQNFASQAGPDGITSVMGLAGAIPILLGDNIGTTITALLASIGQSKNAKRTAIAHSIFNISGSIVFAFLIPWFAKFVTFISPKGDEINIIARQIANAHTTFNIVCTLIWLPLIPLMVKIVTFVIRGSDVVSERLSDPKYLDDKVIGQPQAALYLLSKELVRCSEFTYKMLENMKTEVITSKISKEVSDKADLMCTAVKELRMHISQYITRLFSSGFLTEIQAEQTAGLLYVSNNMSRIADRCEEISSTSRRMKSEEKVLSDQATEEVTQCFDMSSNLFQNAIESVVHGDKHLAQKVIIDKEAVIKAEKKFTKAHLKRVQKNTCDIDLTNDFSDIIYNLGRIADNCVNMADETMDDIKFVSLSEEEKSQILPEGN